MVSSPVCSGIFSPTISGQFLGFLPVRGPVAAQVSAPDFLNSNIMTDVAQLGFRENISWAADACRDPESCVAFGWILHSWISWSITIIDQPAPTQSLSNFHLTSTAKGHKGFDDSSEDLCASDEQFLWTAVVIIMKNHFHTNHTPVQWGSGLNAALVWSSMLLQWQSCNDASLLGQLPQTQVVSNVKDSYRRLERKVLEREIELEIESGSWVIDLLIGFVDWLNVCLVWVVMSESLRQRVNAPLNKQLIEWV